MYLKALVLCALLLVTVTPTPVAKPANIVIFESLEEPCARQGGLCRPSNECDPENLSQLPNLCPNRQHLGYKCCYFIWNNSLSPINQLLLTLRYYATASHQLTMGDFAGVSRPTANRVIHRVTAALASLSKDYIRFPETPEDIRETQMEFYNIAKFPKVIGALDCTHVKMISPGGTYAEIFRNRKGYMSINVQTVCNARLIITDLVARWPGSAHDERIFSASRRNAMFELGTYNDSLLVADSGYMNRSYLMMPLDRIQTNEEASYNEAQIRTRNPIERLFGIWKRRFPVLALGMHVQLKNCLPIIVATAVLHNILQSKGEECPPDDPELQLPTPWESIIEQGRIREQRSSGNSTTVRDINPVRRRLINNYFKTLHYS